MATKQADSSTESADVAVAAASTPSEQANTRGYYLVVRHAFGPHRKGDTIRDEARIAEILGTPASARSVHKVLG